MQVRLIMKLLKYLSRRKALISAHSLWGRECALKRNCWILWEIKRMEL